jgi:hypothetical protein
MWPHLRKKLDMGLSPTHGLEKTQPWFMGLHKAHEFSRVEKEKNQAQQFRARINMKYAVKGIWE